MRIGRLRVCLSFILLLVFCCQTVLPSSASNEAKSESLTVTKAQDTCDLSESLEAYMDYRYNRQKYLTKWAKKRMKVLEEKMSDLEERVSKLGDSSKKNWKENVIPKLKTQRDNFNKKRTELKNSSKELWIHMKWSFGEALETYEQNLKNALSKLKKLEKKEVKNQNN